MATLAPPPASAQKKPASARKKGAPIDANWMRRLTRSGYFLGAVLFHLILALILATIVIFRAPTPPPDDFQKAYVPSTPPPPPPPQSQQTMQVPTTVMTPPTAVITALNPTAPAFTVPLPDLATPTMSQTAKTMMTTIKSPNHLGERLSSIMSTEMGWGRSRANILESGGDPRNVIADFPIYVASYQDGDWGCNTHMKDGRIDAGSMPNLVAKMNEWSHGNLKGHVVPEPLEIGGPDLLAKKPPFIFFTGHKDFHLTDQEVQNLRDYLQDGGAIWGDNALAGKGSRFDIAFKREMKKVIPDIDKNWEDMPMTADLFTKSWFQIDKLPQGMNYYAEPIQHIDIDGKLAVLYTPNDYSDLLYMFIEPGDASEGPIWQTPTEPLFTSELFRSNTVFFRNFTLESCLDAHRLGMNIIAHLLVRFDSDLQLAPP